MNTDSNTDDNTDKLAWHRQFWPWFLIVLPGIVVIASLVTVYIAVTHPDPIVDGDYYRHGLNINEKLDKRAAATTPATTPPAATKKSVQLQADSNATSE